MKDKRELEQILERIDGRRTKEYRSILGDFDFSRFTIKIGDPSEGRNEIPILVRVPQQTVAGFPPHIYNSPVRRTALEDYLTRQVAKVLETLTTFDDSGVARRHIRIAEPGQQILPRTSMVITEELVEARLYVELPENNGRIDAETAKGLFFKDLFAVTDGALIYHNLDLTKVERAVDKMEDAGQIRQILPTQGLVSFIGEDSLLQRKPGTDLPAPERRRSLVIREELIKELEVPNAGRVRGIGIPTGLTLIIGETYSGRTELMHAIVAGIYNHIDGDGREYVVTQPDAVYVASEPARSVQRVDLRTFMPVHPDQDSANYSADITDPCIAQAASTVEMLEVGARALLFDEGDSSPAFLSRDARFDSIISGTYINPLSAVAKDLVEEIGISLVVSGYNCISEFIPIADTILYLSDYEISDITAQAKEGDFRAIGALESAAPITEIVDKARWLVPSSIDASKGLHDLFLDTKGKGRLIFGRTEVNLEAIRQIADKHQTRTIGAILAYAKDRYLDEARTLGEILDLIDRDLSTEGLDCLSSDPDGGYARPRRYEIAAAINRLPTLRIAQSS
jgi:predicted ABC-class ATPase